MLSKKKSSFKKTIPFSGAHGRKPGFSGYKLPPLHLPRGNYFTYYGRQVIASLILIIIIGILYLIFGPRSAYPIKTEIVNLVEEGGEADYKVTITRLPDDTLCITTDASTVTIRDATVYISGNIQIESGHIGKSDLTTYILLQAGQVLIPVPTGITADLTLGTMEAPKSLRFINALGGVSIHLQGGTGSADLIGGINVGTAEGAGPGQMKLSDGTGTITIADNAIYSDQPWWISYGLTTLKLFSNQLKIFGSGLNVGASSRAVAEGYGYFEGGVTIGADSSAAGSNFIFGTIQLDTHTGDPPTASAANCGTFFLCRDDGDTIPDQLWVCLREPFAAGYSWVLVAEGETP